jgi:hypothetical protein
MKQIYEIHAIHLRKIKLLCGGYDAIGLKKYKELDDFNYSEFENDWVILVQVKDERKFNYSLMKYPELYKFLRKFDKYNYE